MGTELLDNGFPFQERARALEMISSWLDMEDVYAPAFPQDQMHDFHVPDHDHHLFHCDSSEFDIDPLSLFPRPDSPFAHALYGPEPYPYKPLIATTTHEQYQLAGLTEQIAEPDECDTFLIDNNEFGLVTPAESQDSGSDDQFYDPTGKMGSDPCDVDTPEPMSVTAEDNEEEVDDEPKPGAVHCKNLLSERNRRKRLSQQLLALRALVPNITKMDKRSVLVDALNYLRNIHEETARLQKELKQQQQQNQLQQPRLKTIRESCLDNPAGTLRVPRTIAAPPSVSKPKAQISEIDTERIEDRRFVVKITCKGSSGAGGDILRVIESMGLEITNATVQQMTPQEILATIFIKVRKPGKMTEEKLKDSVTSMALRSGLTLQNP